jgi:hypothetical protein
MNNSFLSRRFRRWIDGWMDVLGGDPLTNNYMHSHFTSVSFEFILPRVGSETSPRITNTRYTIVQYAIVQSSIHPIVQYPIVDRPTDRPSRALEKALWWGVVKIHQQRLTVSLSLQVFVRSLGLQIFKFEASTLSFDRPKSSRKGVKGGDCDL